MEEHPTGGAPKSGEREKRAIIPPLNIAVWKGEKHGLLQGRAAAEGGG